jgi:hypothetical protein
MGTQNTNLNQSAPCNGVILSGKNVEAIEAMDWTKITNAKIITLQEQFNGGANDCEVQIQVCLEGGEADPVTLTTMNSTSSPYSIVDQCWDRIRMNVTKFTGSGAGSRMLMSAR